MKRKMRSFVGLFLACILVLGNFSTERIGAWEMDTSVESSRDAGTDLYEGAKAKNTLPVTITSSDGSSCGYLLDESFHTAKEFAEGTALTVSAEEEMTGIYIIWDSLVPEWTLEIDGTSYTYGKYGYLHEYIELPKKSKSIVIHIPNGSLLGGNLDGVYEGGMRIADIYAFSSKDVPAFVQKWEPTCTDADVLMVSTHSDDEHIFFGGFLPLYQAEENKKVQVAYFTQHWVYSDYSKIREHEKLNGLWVAGAKYYPILGNFRDAYSESIEGAENTISMEDAELFMTRIIRQTHPLVVALHDTEGEYGHGQHRLNSAAGISAVKLAAIASYDEATVAEYGTWNTPKLYVHLYDDRQILLDMRKELKAFGGKNAISVARQAYLCHESQQQWEKFTVDDYGLYNNALWGLYTSTVGLDKEGNDVLENVRENVDVIRKNAAVSLTGTEEDAISIYDRDDLELIRSNPFGSYILMNDLDLSDEEWMPVDFFGSFYGNGHALLNVKISSCSDMIETSYDGNMKTYDTHFGGFFGVLKNATVKDLQIIGANYEVEANEDTFLGGLAGYAYGCAISNCKVVGDIALYVSGKMFGLGGLVGFGGATTISDSNVDVTLVNVDLDKENKDEQFLAGIFGTGFMDVENCQVVIKGYTSDHGYVHDGGVTGMYLNYMNRQGKCTFSNNYVEGFIRFFEDNEDRRAYCADMAGEVLGNLIYINNASDFKHDEVTDYSSDLLPHSCEDADYVDSQVDGDCIENLFGYTLHTCSICGFEKKDSYKLHDHKLGDAEELIAATYEEQGLEKRVCSLCSREVYAKTPVLEKVVEPEIETEASEEPSVEKKPVKPIAIVIVAFILIFIGVGVLVYRKHMKAK